MEEDEEFVPTGEGNTELGNVCSALFDQTGEISYRNLKWALTASKQDFERAFPLEQNLEEGPTP